jgi:hypothetical protein
MRYGGVHRDNQVELRNRLCSIPKIAEPAAQLGDSLAEVDEPA